MNILVLNYEFPPLGGGAAPVSREIATGLHRLGHSVDVVTMGFRGLPAYEELDGIRIWRVKCWRSKKEVCQPWEQATYLMSAYPLCRRLIKERQYDICHAHFVIPTGALAWVLNKEFHLPYIISSHGSDIPGFNEDRFTLIHRFTRPFLRRIIRDASTVTTPSVFLKELIERQVLQRPDPKIIPLPNGSRSYKIPNVTKENIIVSVGRLLPRKGFQWLISAFKEISNASWRLVIIGDGPFKKRLTDLAGNDRRIIFTGWLEHSGSEFPNWINRSKIFALLSKSESQGIVFLEAMSTGCALMAARGTACSETVTNEVGYLVDPESTNQVRDQLAYLIEHDEERDQLSERALRRYENVYRWENIISKYQDLLTTHARHTNK